MRVLNDCGTICATGAASGSTALAAPSASSFRDKNFVAEDTAVDAGGAEFSGSSRSESPSFADASPVLFTVWGAEASCPIALAPGAEWLCGGNAAPSGLIL